MRTQSDRLGFETPDPNARIALITGATDGIGQAAAGRLAGTGWRVVVVGRNPERVENTVRGLPAGTAIGAVADLTRMADIRALTDRLDLSRLDALVLNANAIIQTRRVTDEGFEANLAVGFLGRTLLQWRLEPLLAATPGSQVLTVVGLDLERLDLAGPQLERGFTARKALLRWQWAVQVLARESNRRGHTPVNVYMPGLVRTKILADEPQPMRALVQVANWLFGIPVPRSGEEMAEVLERVAREGARDGYYARTKEKPRRDLKTTAEDGPALWAWAEEALRRWM